MHHILRFLALTFFLLWVPGGSVRGATAPDLDPALRGWLRADLPPSPASALTPSSVSRLRDLVPRALAGAVTDQGFDVFLRPASGMLPALSGVDLVLVAGDLYAGRVSPDALRSLLASGAIASARLARPVYTTLDRSAVFLGLGSVRRANPTAGIYTGQTGRGVMVASVDTGLDWTHPDFRKPDGTTRLYRYWDQLTGGGRKPEGYPYGSEYTEWYINHGIAGGIDQVGHGTHTLGIAAGNGRGSFQTRMEPPLGGIAPEATLVAVRCDFTEVGVVLGARYVFDQARALGLPAVLNLSLGNHFGPHRGTTAFESALRALVAPGRLIVAAGGNDGDRSLHAEMFFTTGEPRVLTLYVPPYNKSNYPFVVVEGWYARSERLRAVIRNPLGATVGVLDLGDDELQVLDEKGAVRAWHVEDLGMNTVYVEIADNTASTRLAAGTWTVTMEPLSVGPSPEMDWWVVSSAGFERNATPTFTSFVDQEETVLSPACAPDILAVGALATRSCWINAVGVEQCYTSPPVLEEVAFFSSRGPTPDGRPKPEILAPGFGVVSARSSGILPDYMSLEELERLSTPDGLYFVSQGTSMSSPHAAGAAALLLARYPELTYEQLGARLISRGLAMKDWRDGKNLVALQVGDALAPPVDLSLSEVIPDPRGFLIRWSVGRTREPVSYRVVRGFDPEGPFTALATRHLEGDNPFQILDALVEPGRTHYYRVIAVDALGLEDEITSVTAEAAGAPVPAFRAPEPNPAHGPITFRTFVPSGYAPAAVHLTVFDPAGRRVTTLAPGVDPEGGEGIAVWNLTEEGGRRVAAGVYFARLEIAGAGRDPDVFVRRLVVLP